MSARAADIELRLRRRKLRKDKRAAERELRSGGRALAGSLKKGFATGLGQFSAFGTLSGLASVGRDALNFEESLTRIGIQAKGKANLDELRTTAKRTGAELGLSASQVLSAATEIVNLQGASGLSAAKMDTLARASVATGAELRELAGVGFALDNAFKLQGPAEFESAMSAVIEAGKRGSVPLGEMTTVLQQVATQWARVGSSGQRGAAELAAAIQIARRGFGSAAESGTGLKSFIDQLDKSAAFLRDEFKIEIFDKIDGEKELKPITEILDQIAQSPLAKDSELLVEAFGSAPARQFLRTLMANRTEYDNLAQAAEKSNAVQEDSAAFMNSNAGRMQKALAKVRAEVAGLFTPERLQKWTRVVEFAATAVGVLVDNLGGLLTALVSLKAARAALTFVRMRDAAAQLADNAAAAGTGIRGVTRRASGLGGKAKAIGGIGIALGGAALAGWELGRALDNALGLSDSLAGIEQVSETRTKFAEKLRRQVENSDAALADFVRRGVVMGQDVGAIAKRIQAGDSVADEDLALLSILSGGAVLTNQQKRVRLGEASDIEAEAERAQARARNARANNQFQQDQNRIATRLLESEVIRGDRTITRPEIEKALQEAGALTVAAPVATRGLTTDERAQAIELEKARAESENRARIERMVELLEQLNEKTGKKVTVSVAGQTLAEIEENNPNQHRAVTR